MIISKNIGDSAGTNAVTTGMGQPAKPGVKVDLSIVIPLYNEEGNVKPLLEKISAATGKMGLTSEIIAVDDGSSDETVPRLRDELKSHPNLRIILLRKNFGQTPAMTAGMDYARGEVIITMDGDLQNDPEDFAKLLAKLDQGYDIVSGWRKDRKEPFFNRRLPSKIANRLLSKISNVKLHDYGCTLKAYRREVIENINLYGDNHRFVPALASAMGARVAEIEVEHHPRRSGKSKYGLSRTYKVILDMMTLKFMLSFFHRPMLLFGVMGSISGGAGFLLAFWAVIGKLFYNMSLSNRPLFTVASPLLIMMGIQLISIGLIAEMMMRIYHESQKKPTYLVREIIEGADQ